MVGKSSCDKLQPVATYRNIDLFTSRVHPMLAVSMVKECVQDALKASVNSVTYDDADIVCEKLTSKHDSYSSYHVTVKVNSGIFRDAIVVLCPVMFG